MRHWFTANKILTVSSVLFLAGLSITWTVYALVGHQIIAAVYKGTSLQFFKGLMEGRVTTSLEDYYRAADKALRDTSIIAVLIFFMCAVLAKIHLLNKILITSVSLFLSTFLFFCVFEFWPSLVHVFHLYPIRYYAVKDYYIPDDTLVYREKPFYHNIANGFKGDRYSPLYGIAVSPMTVEWINDSDGFRNNTPTSVTDVIVIGDSYVASGANGEDTFGKKLEKHSGFTVANLGIGGHGPFQYLEILKRYGLAKKPKYAIFSFFEGNDLSDIREYLQWSKGGNYYNISVLGKPFFKRYATALHDITRFLYDTACLFAQGVSKQTPPPQGLHPDIAVLNVGNRPQEVLFSYKNKIQAANDIIASDEGEALKTILIDFRKICLEHGVTPILMYIPIASHIYAEYSTAQSGERWRQIREEQIAAKTNTENAVTTLANAVGMEVVSLSPVFEAAAKEGKMLYHAFDTHWNAEGTEVAAVFMAARLHGQSVHEHRGL